MALAFISGSSANIDISLGGTSIKAQYGRWFAQFTRGATRRTTFADNGWVTEQPGEKQLLGTLDGYNTQGVASSDISLYVTAATTTAFILTAETGCTLTFAGNVFSDGADVVAAANAGRQISFRSAGVVTTAWVTS